MLFAGTLLFFVAVFGPARIVKAPEHIFAFFIKPPEARVLFVGDLFFDRYIRQVMDARGGEYVFSCIGDLLGSADLVVGNLEGPITDKPSISAGSEIGSPENFHFTFPPMTAALLAAHNIRMVNLGNNHIMSLGRDGLLQTKERLTAAGVGFFGDPDAGEENRVARIEINGIPTSFVNWSDWTSDKTDHTVAQVKKEVKAGRTTLVYAHWGEEYEEPLARMKDLARSFIDAGAIAVFGSHPHIVQEHEVYKGKDIYYSLGNFIFDQYWDSSVRCGAVLSVTIAPHKEMSFRLIETLFENGRVRIGVCD